MNEPHWSHRVGTTTCRDEDRTVGSNGSAALCPVPTDSALVPQLREYLQLTPTQVLGISFNNDYYDRQQAIRSLRIAEVQAEIAVETAKDPLDSAALGVRYAEIELIRRDLREARQRHAETESDATERRTTSQDESAGRSSKAPPPRSSSGGGKLLRSEPTGSTAIGAIVVPIP